MWTAKGYAVRTVGGSVGVLPEDRQPALGPVEPQVDLAGPERVLILAVLTTRRSEVRLPERPGQHEVVGEHRLGPEAHEVRHGVQDPPVIALREPRDAFQVRGIRLGGEDVLGSGGLVVAQVAQLPEGVRESAAADEQDLAVGLGDGLTDGPAGAQEVIGLARLGD